MKYLLSTLLFLLASVGSLQAQSSNYTLMDQSTMTIEGTSTIHDWECDVQEMQADINLDSSSFEGAKSNPVSSLSLTIPVESIESGKGGMNRKMYGALDEKKHPNIIFELTGTEFITQPQATNGNDANYQLTATGMLTIAGTTNEVSFPVETTIQDDGSYKFMGSYEINMKDYNVDPPSAMLGTIKSGEMVTVSFEVYFKKNNL